MEVNSFIEGFTHLATTVAEQANQAVAQYGEENCNLGVAIILIGKMDNGMINNLSAFNINPIEIISGLDIAKHQIISNITNGGNTSHDSY